ncbi:hypothetical protein MG9_04564 [Candida albicans P37037]|nr:hypothetical protein MG9_04564 [Candida albicans P37037]
MIHKISYISVARCRPCSGIAQIYVFLLCKNGSAEKGDIQISWKSLRGITKGKFPNVKGKTTKYLVFIPLVVVEFVFLVLRYSPFLFRILPFISNLLKTPTGVAPAISVLKLAG